MAGSPRYVIITPVRDEKRYVRHTINSVLSQSVHPVEWIIVDDGSSDGTGRILDKYAGEIDWIKVVHRTNQGFRAPGGKVVAAFYAGYDVLIDSRWDFIVKLDCDLSFEPDYFERLLGKFKQDEQLGIASGVYLEQNGTGLWKEIEMPSYHAAGACKVIRRRCFEEIRGFVAKAGWDTVDEIRAMSRGWRTGHFRDLQMKHHKVEGSGVGINRTSMMHGEIYFLTGGSKLFFLLKIIHRIGTKPYLLNALALSWGYLRAVLNRRERLVTPEEVKCYQALLHKRLRMRARRLFVGN
jgi:glycosyltransferase involved in cell wall biosynthesis